MNELFLVAGYYRWNCYPYRRLVNKGYGEKITPKNFAFAGTKRP